MSTSTPWGHAQSSDQIAPGIMSYSTASHGGIHLSARRLAQLPDYLRHDDGWYEEDCEWAIVCCCFPLEWQAWEAKQEWKVEKTALDHAKRTLRHWLPDSYERLYGVILAPGESRTKDQRQWDQDHLAHWIGVAACGSWHKDCPDGMVMVSACIGGQSRVDGHYHGELHDFLVPEAEYHARGAFGFIVDPFRHQEVDVPSSSGG